MMGAVDRQQLGRRLRTLRAAQGRTVAGVATDAGLSVPYVANLENGRGNPTLDALHRIAQALGTSLDVTFTADNAAESNAVAVPPTLVRFSRGPRFRRDVQALAETLNEDPTALAARLLDALSRLSDVTGRDPGEYDYHRLLDALILVAAHPQPDR